MNTRATATSADASDGNGTIQPGVTLLVSPATGTTTRAQTGLAHLELRVPIAEDTAFNVGSVAKQITAYLCVRAAQDGLLVLDGPVKAYLPRFGVPGVTVRDLIQHQGGVRDAESLLSLAGFRDLDHYTADDLLQLAYRQDCRAVPPGRFLYSNTGYLLLAEILRSVHGGDIQDIAQRELFAPLDMGATRFKRHPSEVIPGAAASYGPSPGNWSHQQRPVSLPGPGALWSTAEDLNRWLTHLAGDWHGIPGAALPLERQIGYLPSDHPPFTYGPGLYADPHPQRTAVFHFGHEQGFSAAVHLTRSSLRIVCLSNRSDIPADRIAATAADELTRSPDADARHLLAHAARIAPVPDGHSGLRARLKEILDASHTVLGTYVCDDVPGDLRLSRRAGALYLWRRGAGEQLTRTGTDRYVSTGLGLYFPGAPRKDAEFSPDAFILDLDRAPGLHYRLRPDRAAAT